MDAISLSLFSSRLEAICAEMGAVLRRAALSPNIRDRLDFSCAIFDAAGELCAQAAHIPVHLGSMAYAMRDVVSRLQWSPGDMVVVNDPFMGGTHLPDVSLIAPVFVSGELAGFAVNRAHHADIGANAPGSMPIANTLAEEGMVIPPSYLLRDGKLDQAFFQRIAGGTRNQHEFAGDFQAQISANRSGVQGLTRLVEGLGVAQFRQGLAALNDYGERLALASLESIPNGVYRFRDWMDDDGLGHQDIAIALSLTVNDGRVQVDFTGTAGQTEGNINCPLSVAAAGVFYVFRCLMPSHTPACAGTFRPISLTAPVGCLVNAQAPAAVAAGNVETSTRVVDAVMGALAQAIPQRIPAASHGSMNNLAMGARVPGNDWDYYETIGGGMGAGPNVDGLNAVQTHMTNTLNTPIEVLEQRYPLRVLRYEIRRGSGGDGRHCGGDGLVREFQLLKPTHITVLSERRRHSPWGLAGGQAGAMGENLRNGKAVGGKASWQATAGDTFTINTPGGGGWGNKE